MKIDESSEDRIIIKIPLVFSYILANSEVIFYIIIGSFCLLIALLGLLSVTELPFEFHGFASIATILVIFLSLRKVCSDPTLVTRTIILHGEEKICIVNTKILFKRIQSEHPFESFNSIILSSSPDNTYSLATLSGKKSFILGKSTFHNAERLCKYLSLPLQFKVGSEVIIQFPSDINEEQVSDLTELTCTKCGANSHKINNTRSILTCTFCNTVSRVEWKRA